MTFGCTLPSRGPLATPDSLCALATRAEELGFDHIWVSDHIVIPEQVVSSYPYAPTGVAPFVSDPKQPYCEPLASLCYLAGSTRRIKLGTHVLILPYREPVLAAKMVATLDYMSGGRVILGVGVGWMKEEFEALGLNTFGRAGQGKRRVHPNLQGAADQGRSQLPGPLLQVFTRELLSQARAEAASAHLGWRAHACRPQESGRAGRRMDAHRFKTPGGAGARGAG